MTPDGAPVAPTPPAAPREPRATPGAARATAVDAPGGPAFWIATLAGLGILGFGVYGLVHDRVQTMPLDWLRYVAGALVLHDLIWAPAVGLASLLLVRLVPAPVRPALQGTLLASVAAFLVVLPALTGRGRNPNNPSILPGHYATDLLKVLVAVWLVGALLALRGLRRGSDATDPPRPDPPAPAPRHGW